MDQCLVSATDLQEKQKDSRRVRMPDRLDISDSLGNDLRCAPGESMDGQDGWAPIRTTGETTAGRLLSGLASGRGGCHRVSKNGASQDDSVTEVKRDAMLRAEL